MQSPAPYVRTFILGIIACFGLAATAHAQLTVDVDNSGSQELVIAVDAADLLATLQAELRRAASRQISPGRGTGTGTGGAKFLRP